jgi:hypothetical protein
MRKSPKKGGRGATEEAPEVFHLMATSKPFLLKCEESPKKPSKSIYLSIYLYIYRQEISLS